jgi:hypothetical protein
MCGARKTLSRDDKANPVLRAQTTALSYVSKQMRAQP